MIHKQGAVMYRAFVLVHASFFRPALRGHQACNSELQAFFRFITDLREKIPEHQQKQQ